jgi:L-galactose dehydrogenase
VQGYPLSVQHQILERSLHEFGRNIWDQSLTYSHYNLHDTSLLHRPMGTKASFVDYCIDQGILVLAAAPLSMGLLTETGPPDWHPASPELKQACRQTGLLCQQHGVDISMLALAFALSNVRIPATIVGMRCIEEVQTAHEVALRFVGVSPTLTQSEVLNKVLSPSESRALASVRDPVNGPFAMLWKTGLDQWDGVQVVRQFWKDVPDAEIEHWQN